MPSATAPMIATRATPDGTSSVRRKSETMRPSSSREYVPPMRRITVKASRRARPDFIAIAPNSIAPNRNHGVVFEKPANATGNGTTPSAHAR